MDPVSLYYMISKASSKISEDFVDTPPTATPKATPPVVVKKEDTKVGTGIGIVFFLIFVGFGIWAAVFSWRSNTVAQWTTGFKVFFAFIAFFNGLGYLLGHLIYKVDLLTRIEQLDPSPKMI